MKRLVIFFVASAVAASAFAAPKPPKRQPASPGRRSSRRSEPRADEVVRKIEPAELKRGMRVKLQLKYGRPVVGTVVRLSKKQVQIDLSDEPAGLSGKFRFDRADILSVHELKKLTAEERNSIRTARRRAISHIKTETRAAYARRKAREKKLEEKKKTAREEYRKALDVVIAEKEQEKMRALLQEFPPSEWGEAKYNKIRDDWLLRDLAPTPSERRFTAVFKEWKLARDTIPLIDARNDHERGRLLLLKFPPSGGWGSSRREQIAVKETKGEKLTAAEAEFKKSYEAWSEAVHRRADEVKTETEKKQE